jgi:hypothetical protein
LEDCVERTYNDLLNTEKLRFYKLVLNEITVGYFCVEILKGVKFLTGFALKPNYRTQELKRKFWEIVNEKMNGDYYCGIYSKNKRAKGFLIKSMELIKEENNIVVFKNKRICR